MGHDYGQLPDVPQEVPRHVTKSKFRLPGGRFSAWLSLVFFAFTIGVLAMDEETLRGLLAMPVWFAILGIGWFFKRRADARRHESNLPAPRDCDCGHPRFSRHAKHPR